MQKAGKSKNTNKDGAATLPTKAVYNAPRLSVKNSPQLLKAIALRYCFVA